MSQFKAAIAIHGGAGLLNPPDYSPEKLDNYFRTLQESLKTGHKILEQGGSSVEAVIQSVKVMENCPLFNAGKGGVFAENGIVELDASIMDGKNLKAGAVTCVHKIKNPIVAAREVMDFSPHVILSGDGAELFAYKRALEILPGAVSWFLIIFPIWGSFVVPELVAYYILAYCVYWLYRSLTMAVLAIVSHFRVQASMKYDWVGDLSLFPDWEKVYHIVVIPTYKEPLKTLERTLEALKSQSFPLERLAVMISFEVREGEAGRVTLL